MAIRGGKIAESKVFENIRKRAEKKAEEKLRESLMPLLQQAYSELEGFRPLTGNLNNSLGVALYKDGKCIEAHGSIEITGKRPVRPTLKNGDIFWEPVTWNGNHLDGPIAKMDWVGDKNIWADTEVLRWLERYAPTKKGFSYRIVSIVDYAKYLETKGNVNVLSNIIERLRAMGADINDLNFG